MIDRRGRDFAHCILASGTIPFANLDILRVDLTGLIVMDHSFVVGANFGNEIVALRLFSSGRESTASAIFNEGLCKTVKQYLKNGSKVYLEGALQTRKWLDKDGHDRYSTEVVLLGFNSQFTILDTRAAAAARRTIPTAILVVAQFEIEILSRCRHVMSQFWLFISPA